MCNNFDFDFVDVHVESARGGRVKHDHEVYLTGKNRKAAGFKYDKIHISADLLEESGWKANDRVTIMKARGLDKVYAIRRQNEGNGKGELTLTKCGKSLCIGGINACLALEYAVNGIVFEAWYDKSDKIIMRPKRES